MASSITQDVSILDTVVLLVWLFRTSQIPEIYFQFKLIDSYCIPSLSFYRFKKLESIQSILSLLGPLSKIRDVSWMILAALLTHSYTKLIFLEHK